MSSTVAPTLGLLGPLGRNLLFVLALVPWTGGCGGAEKVEATVPVEAVAGQSLVIQGAYLGERAMVQLVAAGSEPVLVPDAVAIGQDGLRVTLPEQMRPGRYDLVVTRDGAVSTLAGAVLVVPPPDEAPCHRDYTANTELSLARKEVVVHRFYRDKTEETLRTPLSDIDAVEYEMVREVSGELCSVIYMHKSDGSRFVFHADGAVDLESRAAKLAASMTRPVRTTRQDAEGFADAEE